MLINSTGIVLGTNYIVVKTESIFRLGSHNSNNSIKEEPLEWTFRQIKYKPSYPQYYSQPKSIETELNNFPQKYSHRRKKKIKDHSGKIKAKGKGKECVHLKKIRKGKKFFKKFLTPIFLGVLAAKSLLLPAALKAIAFMSAKGLMMSFFSAILATLVGLKGIFDQSHAHQKGNEETKTKVEIIYIPTKSKDHYYHDDYYKRKGDTVVRRKNKI